MSRDNGTFILSTTYSSFVNKMTDSQVAVLFRNILRHQSGEQLLDMDDKTEMAFSYISERLNENDVRYAEKCEKNKQAIAERWRKEKEKSNDTNVFGCIHSNTNDTNEYHNDNENDNGNGNGNENGNGNGNENGNGKNIINKESKEKKRNFVPPSLSEVTAYCQSRNSGIDAQRFIDFYDSKGWMIGKNKMKDWKAAVRTWEQRDKKELSPEAERTRRRLEEMDVEEKELWGE